FGSPQTQRLYPAEHPDYYTRLPAFFAQLASFGLYAEFVAFADTARSVPGKDAQLAHWAALVAAFRGIPNVLLEKVNEQDAHENRTDVEMPRPDGICCSNESNGGGSN